MDTKAISPSDEELIKVLARVVGVELHESEKGWMYWYNFGHGESLQVWNPLHDANQMERVKEALKCRGVEYVITSAHLVNAYVAEMILADGVFDGKDKSELRAFALSVYAMEQSQKGTT